MRQTLINPLTPLSAFLRSTLTERYGEAPAAGVRPRLLRLRRECSKPSRAGLTRDRIGGQSAGGRGLRGKLAARGKRSWARKSGNGESGFATFALGAFAFVNVRPVGTVLGGAVGAPKYVDSLQVVGAGLPCGTNDSLAVSVDVARVSGLHLHNRALRELCGQAARRTAAARTATPSTIPAAIATFRSWGLVGVPVSM